MWDFIFFGAILIRHVHNFVLDKVETMSRGRQLGLANNADANMVQVVRLCYNMKPRPNKYVLLYIFTFILLKYSQNNCYIEHKISVFLLYTLIEHIIMFR